MIMSNENECMLTMRYVCGYDRARCCAGKLSDFICDVTLV